jgi:hypothetical protein
MRGERARSPRGGIAVLQQQHAEAAIGRRVFIKGLAATGALVGGLAVAGLAPAGDAKGARARGRGGRPSPFSQGWTSQAGRFFDDVSLPEGFTYDVVASHRDPIGGARPSATTTTSPPTSRW